jgi:glutamyl-tRNA synthetase
MMVRVRIAPSPTGDPHVGTAYIALFNSAFAKQHKGKFILRIEDTDQARYRPQSEKAIMRCLEWLGIPWDEGPDKPGKFGPYRQSERKEIYQKHIQELLAKNEAYLCFCTSDRLNLLRKRQLAGKEQPKYDRQCLKLSEAELQKKKDAGELFVIRMKIPDGKTSFEDALRGKTEFENKQLDDQVLIKSDGMPTYHFANVVDDHLMEITHVIRAEEWVSSTPKHSLLYRAFGWKEPAFYHLPLLRNQDKSKISKRKNPTSLEYYQALGVLPEAMINFLALQGWSHPEEKDIFSLDEFIRVLDLNKISLGGPVFDLKKLSWVNGEHLRALSPEAWQKKVINFHFSADRLRKIVPLVQERMEFLSDYFKWSSSFYSFYVTYREEDFPFKKLPKEDCIKHLEAVIQGLESLSDHTTEALERFFRTYSETEGLKPGPLFMLLRIAFYGDKQSPPLFPGMALMPRIVLTTRLTSALNYLKST